jgi:hypothetical protein
MSEEEIVYRSFTLEEWLKLENIEESMPNIVGHYQETSLATIDYNCLSWAVGRIDTYLDPELNHVGYTWPDNVEREWTAKGCSKVLAHYGYSEESGDTSFEDDYVKVVMYVDKSGTPTHFARQIHGGKWTSKLGDKVDIVHDNLECMAGDDFEHYGTVRYIFRKRAQKAIWPPIDENGPTNTTPSLP